MHIHRHTCLCAFVCYLAEQAVVFAAHGAVEGVDCVLVHTPARAVCGGTVITALTARLGYRQTPLQPALVFFTRNQLTQKKHNSFIMHYMDVCILAVTVICRSLDTPGHDILLVVYVQICLHPLKGTHLCIF